MEFIHIADVHLGAVPDEGFSWSDQRKEEIWESFRRLIRLVQREEPELLLIAGDLFHRQPLQRELKEVNYLFSTIPHTTVVLIAGNHDFIKRESWYQRFPWAPNVLGLWGDQMEKVYIPEADAWIYGFSYHSREIVEGRYDQVVPSEENGFKILLAHGGDERHIPLKREQIASAGFHYVALGHIHKPVELAGERMRYAGALEPLDRNDIGVHGFIRGHVIRGVLHTEFVPWAVRSYVPMTITVTPEATQFSLEEEIAAQIQQEGSRNIYKVELHGFRDAAITLDKERISRLGNVVDVTDNTTPDYDLKQMEEQYGDSLIGQYIRYFKNNTGDMEQKALYYGLAALLSSEGQL